MMENENEQAATDMGYEQFTPKTDYRNRTVVEVLNLRWVNSEQTMLDADVLFEELRPMGHIPFTTMDEADTDHGQEIWDKAIAGEYGPIASYVASPPTPSDVDRERDRRIDSGFSFGGVFYQTRPEDRENIAGASTAALAAIMNGAQSGDYRWHGGDTDFVWIAADNSTHAMDAQTLFAFGQAAMEHKQAHIFAARAIKDTDPIPADFADDAYWP